MTRDDQQVLKKALTNGQRGSPRTNHFRIGALGELFPAWDTGCRQLKESGRVSQLAMRFGGFAASTRPQVRGPTRQKPVD